jgi:hypothetical protein
MKCDLLFICRLRHESITGLMYDKTFITNKIYNKN